MQFKHRAAIQLRFADTDMLGHINNANFLTYMELARMSYFHDVIGDAVDWNKEGIIVAKAEVVYKQPIFLEDQLVIEIGVEHISSKSFLIRYRFLKTNHTPEILAAEGSTLMVCYDYVANKSIVMPASWREKITVFDELPR